MGFDLQCDLCAKGIMVWGRSWKLLQQKRNKACEMDIPRLISCLGIEWVFLKEALLGEPIVQEFYCFKLICKMQCGPPIYQSTTIGLNYNYLLVFLHL